LCHSWLLLLVLLLLLLLALVCFEVLQAKR
jgi:hypothetical protein